jgi:D-alanyl-D-alanine carboxypeptidase
VFRVTTIAIVLVVVTSCTSTGAPSGGAEARSAMTTAAPADATHAQNVTSRARFHGSVSPLRGSARRHVRTLNWHPGCPVPVSQLRLVRVTYVDRRGDVRTGPLVLNANVAHDVLWVFRQLFRAGFPIHRIDLSPRPQPIDWNSTRNLTSSFNCRSATGNPGVLSEHSYGWAVDINPLQNPYVRGDGSVLRAAAKPFVDRSRHVPGMIHPGDVVVRSFAKIGWGWGGNWHTLKDYMHFSATGR